VEARVSRPETLNQLFFDAVERFSSKRAAVRFKTGDAWHDITHAELARHVEHTALGLYELGIRPNDRVAILSENRPEWAIADFACLTARCTDVPIYPSLPASQVAYLLKDSGARAVFVDNAEQYEKVEEVRGQLRDLAYVIAFDERVQGRGVIGFRELRQHGRAAEPKHPGYREDALDVSPDELATLIYTSGTTGQPKGVMLTHANFCSNVRAVLQVISIGPDDSCLSLLPLSHSFERMAGHYTMFHTGVTISYAESIDKVAQNLTEVRPTVVLSVPRLFEKIYARVLENAMTGGALQRRIFFWARRNAEAWIDRSLADEPIPLTLSAKKTVADKLVFSKLRDRTGNRIRFFVSGGAPLNKDIARFFFAAGLPILEGYGLTETSPVVTVNPLERPKLGTVGPAIPGVAIEIADDGEILVRGPNVMRGYYNLPDATERAIDRNGWFHTGDVGEMDDDGYLTITDRKKDLIATAGGKKIAPQPIENMVKANAFVSMAVMVGERRKFPAIIIVPEFDALERWARERNLTLPERRDEIIEQPDVQAKMEREVMGSLRDLASFEMPKKVLLLPDEFTIESGELTPTLKVKRNVVEERYKSQINRLYDEI
jgi:long-chain acyl-CoA synthetase